MTSAELTRRITAAHLRTRKPWGKRALGVIIEPTYVHSSAKKGAHSHLLCAYRTMCRPGDHPAIVNSTSDATTVATSAMPVTARAPAPETETEPGAPGRFTPFLLEGCPPDMIAFAHGGASSGHVLKSGFHGAVQDSRPGCPRSVARKKLEGCAPGSHIQQGSPSSKPLLWPSPAAS